MDNKLCVYAICKNEIDNVAQWIDNMSEADYIVVLDTGSTDGTYEVLKNDPRVTKVKQKIINPWRFDVARNESMKLVPKDANILLCTDFDERFTTSGWANLIKSNWTEDTWRGHYLYIWSHTNIGNAGDAFWYDKLHTRKYKWVFPVHEVLCPIEGMDTMNQEYEGHLIEFNDSIILEHYPDENKTRDYLNLLHLRLEENPEDSYSYFLLGREYGILNDYNNCIKYFEEALNLEDIKYRKLTEYCILGYLGDIYASLGNLSLSAYYYNRQIEKDPTYREPYFNLADIYNRLRLYETAITFVKAGIERSFRHYDWTERSICWNGMADDLLSVSYYYLNLPREGLSHAIKALQFDPMNERIQKNYLALLELINKVSEE